MNKLALGNGNGNGNWQWYVANENHPSWGNISQTNDR